MKLPRVELLWQVAGVLTLCGNAIGQKRPPNYSQDDMPVTNFSCGDKVIGGYYADPETDCQMFHVCVHVPGVGIQDFRFLCPNDTSFDQEHQICDDWYNIDCELSSLYYSDNFDLYRIGANIEVKKPPISNKGTPIPLGPSSTIKPWQADKPKKNQYEDEDDYKRSGNDILRGSHSSNFYASSNRGRDDLDENDYDSAVANVGANRQKLVPTNTVEAKKQKTFVRKLASKRPVTQRPVQQYYNEQQQYSTDATRLYTTTTTAASTATPLYVHQSSPNFNNQFVYSKKTSPTQQSRGNVNFNSYASKIQKNEYNRQQQKVVATVSTSPTIYQRINNLTEIELDNSQETVAAAAVTSTYEPSKTYENTYNFRQQTQAFNRQKIPAPKITYPSSQPTQTTFQADTVRSPSTDYLRTIAQTYQQPAVFINDQLQNTGRPNYQRQPQQQYNQQYRSPTTKAAPQFSTYDAEYQQYLNGPTGPARIGQTSSPVNAFQTKKSTAYPATDRSYATTPAAGGTYWQPNATSFDYSNNQKYYQTSPSSPTSNPYFTSTAFDYYRQQSSPASAATYDPYATFQKASTNDDKYNDEEEFLKTAHSSNLKPSDINTIYNQKKQLYINATLKAAYSVDQPAKSSYNRQQSSTAKSTSIRPSIDANNYAVVGSSPTARHQTATSPRSAHGKTIAFGSLATNTTASKNSDYDYAYYDNGGGNGSSEYDQLDTVEQDFVKIHKIHNTKSKA